MFKTPSHLTLLILATIALGAGTASAQEPAKFPPRGRLLGLLNPGQRVRLDDMGQQDPTGLQLTLVPEAQWKEIEQGAEERMRRIKELEDQLTKLNSERDELLSIFQLPEPGERSGLDRNAINDLQQVQRRIQQDSQKIYAEIDALRGKLPSSVGRIAVVGEDYFGLDNGNAVVFYPASRLREITQPKKIQPSAAAERPASPESSDPDPAEDAGVETEAGTESADEDPSSANNADVEN